MPASTRPRRASTAMALALMLVASAICGGKARAEASGPDHWRIKSDVAQAAMLETPSDDAAIVARLPAGTDGLANLGCEGGLDYAAWQAATEVERAEAALRRWCRVRHAGLIGWVKGIMLEEGAAAAAYGSSFDCTKADGAAETAVCSGRELAALDRELARVYALAGESLPRRSEQARLLRAEQRGWIKGRDECWKAGKMLRACVADEYVLRIAGLRQGFEAARRPGTGTTGSSGPVAYRCTGLGAPLSVTFVQTGANAGHNDFAALRLSDAQYALVRLPSASGERYVHRVTGLELRVDEATAVLARAEGPALACRRRGAR
ncbi:MAG: lysozyme inhibitor LprI family protein [Pseudomonadota bacterium]